MDSGELNIPSSVNDPHYRYKMPKIRATIQGTGNGIKTNWVNLPEVSNALKVPVEYPIKFIGRELGANTDIKPNSYLINGSHQVEKMQELLDKFIKKYVLCPKCHLPEIHGKIKVSKKDIKSTCRSCGSTCKLDNAHDFATYIRRNPPPYEEDDKVAGGKVPSGEKKPKKEFDKELKKKNQRMLSRLTRENR
jgi:translation initiation factor 5